VAFPMMIVNLKKMTEALDQHLALEKTPISSRLLGKDIRYSL
jgi:hypothetical protein